MPRLLGIVTILLHAWLKEGPNGLGLRSQKSEVGNFIAIDRSCGGCVEYKAINFEDKLAKFSEHWSPKIVAQMNDYHFKLVKLQGDFVWHRHADTDEVFIVLDGDMMIDFRDGRVDLEAGEMFVVPKGVEHRPHAEKECRVLLVEPTGTINTGDAGGALTARDNVWI